MSKAVSDPSAAIAELTGVVCRVCRVRQTANTKVRFLEVVVVVVVIEANLFLVLVVDAC